MRRYLVVLLITFGILNSMGMRLKILLSGIGVGIHAGDELRDYYKRGALYAPEQEKAKPLTSQDTDFQRRVQGVLDQNDLGDYTVYIHEHSSFSVWTQPVIFLQDARSIQRFMNTCDRRYSIEEAQDAQIAALWHECYHARYDQNRHWLAVGARAGTSFACLAGFTAFLQKIKPPYLAQAVLIGVGSCVVYDKTQLLSKLFSINSEVQADEHIPDDFHLLRAKYDYFTRLDSAYNQRPWYRRTHPTHSYRAQRFKERLDALQEDSLR